MACAVMSGATAHWHLPVVEDTQSRLLAMLCMLVGSLCIVWYTMFSCAAAVHNKKQCAHTHSSLWAVLLHLPYVNVTHTMY